MNSDFDFEFEEKWLIHAVTDAAFRLPFMEVWLDRIFHRQIIFIAPVPETLFSKIRCTIFDTWIGSIETEVLDEYEQVLVIQRW